MTSLGLDRKSVLLLFFAYNALLASVLIGPLASPRESSQRTISFSDSDFGSVTSLPTPPVRISKPFSAVIGETLSFSFQDYSIDNQTGFVVGVHDCGPCDMAIASLPLAPAPTPARNGTILTGTYSVTRSAQYVLLVDTRDYKSCSAGTFCTVKLAGTVTATVSPTSNNLSLPLAILGLLLIVPPAIWTIMRRRGSGK